LDRAQQIAMLLTVNRLLTGSEAIGNASHTEKAARNDV
jgi:hypothetical protein